MLLSLAAVPAAAVDGMALEAGSGEGNEMGRIALQWNWGKRWFQGSEWHHGGYWDLGLGYWRRDAIPGDNGNVTEIGLTPVFRLQQNRLMGVYIEGGIGAHLYPGPRSATSA